MNEASTNQETPAVIQLQSVIKTFERRGRPPIQAVKDVSLSINKGEVLGFLGPNGAGKTTIIKIVCGLIQPTVGKVWINGYDPIRDRRKVLPHVGVVLEGTRNVYWRLSVWQNVTYFARLKGASRKSWRERANWLLDELDLADRCSDLVQDLSRGMQQKVAIACALINDPMILVLDEPTLGLDVESGRTVRDWVRRLSTEQGKTVLLTTHRLDMAEEVCDRVAIIREGALLTNMMVVDLLDSHSTATYRIILDCPVDALGSDLADLTTGESEGRTVISGIQPYQSCLGAVLRPGFPILGVFWLIGQPKRDGSIIVRSYKASQSPVYPIRDAILAVNHASCPSLSSSGPPPMG